MNHMNQEGLWTIEEVSSFEDYHTGPTVFIVHKLLGDDWHFNSLTEAREFVAEMSEPPKPRISIWHSIMPE